MPTSIKYHFIQHFRVPADRAYAWCVDYDPNDLELMHEKGTRKIERLSEDAVILTEEIHPDDGSTISKTKLVRLHPSERFWTNTQIEGPAKYSQFLYRIIPEGKSKSRLEFVGLQLEPKTMTKKDAADFARKVRKDDSTAWKYLARAMEKELMS